jgi:hypothetical protein
MQDALSDKRLNLQEAAQLVRLTPERLDCPLAEAHSTRAKILRVLLGHSRVADPAAGMHPRAALGSRA